MQLKHTGFIPNSASTDDENLMIIRNRGEMNASDGLPVPEGEFAKYGQDRERHLASSERDFGKMQDIFEAADLSFKNLDRVLDFGCANGRILRQFAPLAQADHTKEFWGCDIDAIRVLWCEENLAPPFHFFVNTSHPHLPFADGYFDFIYAYSIFTHIDDLFTSWLLELRRVLRPNGYLLITLHDEVSAQWGHDHPDHDLIHKLVTQYWDSFRMLLTGDINMISTGRQHFAPQVFVRREYFLSLVEQFLDVISVTDYAMGFYQTAVLMKKRAR